LFSAIIDGQKTEHAQVAGRVTASDITSAFSRLFLKIDVDDIPLPYVSSSPGAAALSASRTSTVLW
jgi:hypothetical protein